MADLSESMYNLALQPLKTYPHYHSVDGHQTWQDRNLTRGALSYKVT